MNESKAHAQHDGDQALRREPRDRKPAVGRLGGVLGGRRIGIGYRLFGAFGAVAFPTLVARAIAWFSFANVGSVLHQVTGRSWPARPDNRKRLGEGKGWRVR